MAQIGNSNSYFSTDYATARCRFVHAARSVGASLIQLPLPEKGPKGEALAVDIAWVGSRNPRRVVIHVCGIHGVEGFAGSAIQLKLLEDLPCIKHDAAVIFVHVLNPYGMAWLRRFNENNVDLNRNYLMQGESWSGAPEIYAELDGFFNPKKPPSWDSFYLQALLNTLRYGFSTLKKVVAGGQYEYPQGLFYGGKELEKELEIYREWLQESFSSTERFFVIDVHTGLGQWCQNSLFHKVQATRRDAFPETIQMRLAGEWEESKVVGYQFKGGHWALYQELFKEVRVDFIVQEFGTYGELSMLKGLRAENQYHHHGGSDISHWSKTALKDLFCPSSEKWRVSSLQEGDLLFRGVVKAAVT